MQDKKTRDDRDRERMDADRGRVAGLAASASTSSVALRMERYQPKIFGFHVNEIARLQRWQSAVRDRYAFRPSLASLSLAHTLFRQVTRLEQLELDGRLQ